MSEILAALLFAATLAALLAGFPVAFTLAGSALIFAVLGHFAGVFELSLLGAFVLQIFGRMTNELLIAVPLFVFMGVMLERSRVAEELLETMSRAFGSMRGSLGISVILVGALLAASTGIVGATVVTMGLLSLPTMLKRGYDPKLAAGTICAAGTLGQIIPPSIVLVLLGEVISSSYQQVQLSKGNFAPDSISVGDLFAGALFPGLLLVALYVVYQIGVAWLRPLAAPAIPARELAEGGPGVRQLFYGLAPPVILIFAVLGSILAGIATPTEAAAIGAVGATLLAGERMDGHRKFPIHAAAVSMVVLLVLTASLDLRLGRTTVSMADRAGIYAAFVFSAILAWGLGVALVRLFRVGVLREVMEATTRVTSMVFVILIGAALFSLVFRGFGGDDMVHRVLTSLPGGAVTTMVLVMAVMFVLGFFLDFIEIIYVVVPIVAPTLMLMGIDPLWLGVMIAVNLQTSFLTPPFGFALFYLRGVAPPQVTTMDIYRGVAPFVVIQLLALGILALFPGIVVWLPRVIYG